VLVRWPYEVDGKRQWQREAVEMTVWGAKKKDPLERGLAPWHAIATEHD
jgi:hypothetical protein